MKKDDILQTIQSLARSQGFYGRLLREIQEEPEILDILEKEKFKDSLDLILFLES